MHIDKYHDPEKLKRLRAHIREKHKDLIKFDGISNRELTVVTRQRDLQKLLSFLREDRDCQFKMLIDVCGVDDNTQDERFQVVYQLLSLVHNMRIRIKVFMSENQTIPSVSNIYSNAIWYEREVYDMFGLIFENHPDLRRILTDYDFEDFPLRKDFPVEGKVEMFYDEEQQRCVYRPTKLAQPYRHFEWESPWQAMDNPYHLSEEDNAFDRGEFDEITQPEQEEGTS
mgnify:CR=1 FL=1